MPSCRCGHDSNPFRTALAECGIAAFGVQSPLKKNRKTAHPLRQGALPPAPPHRVAFGRLKDRRRIATRYDRCATAFCGAITIVIF